MNAYEQLRESLDAHPSTAPQGPAIDEILSILFTPEEAALVHEDKCIGCGLCVSSCSSRAMGLIERKQVPSVPPTTQDMAVKVLSEKGRLEAFMKVMQN